MIIGRLFGWCFVVVAIVMASAEAVMALGTGGYDGIAAAEVLTLLIGETPEVTAAPQGVDALFHLFMAMPAWTMIGAIGLVLLHTFRDRRRYLLRRRPSSFV